MYDHGKESRVCVRIIECQSHTKSGNFRVASSECHVDGSGPRPYLHNSKSSTVSALDGEHYFNFTCRVYVES